MPNILRLSMRLFAALYCKGLGCPKWMHKRILMRMHAQLPQLILTQTIEPVVRIPCFNTTAHTTRCVGGTKSSGG